MNTTDIKTEADTYIGKLVKFPILVDSNIIFKELELTTNKIMKDKDIVLSTFKDSSIIVNALCFLSKPYEVVLESTPTATIE